MGGKNEKPAPVKLEQVQSMKDASAILGLALDDLKEDWAKVKGEPVESIKWAKTTININEFKKLMDPSWSQKDIEALFGLYDFNHDNSITWKEYICVCALIMAGNVNEKVKLIFNCFDEDGNGTLSKEEFRSAAKRFCTKNPAQLEAFVDNVFKSCDTDGDNKVTLQEFYAWQKSHTADFEEFAGTINILKTE